MGLPHYAVERQITASGLGKWYNWGNEIESPGGASTPPARQSERSLTMRGHATITLPCEHCGIPFQFYRSRHQRFCSPACAMANRTRRALARFWDQVDKGDAPDSCWLWRGNLDTKGYGYLRLAGKHRLAHRVAYELLHGPIPAGLFVCHHCDNPQCVRPAHCFVGTAADNIADCRNKGRIARGDRHGARLHPERHSHGERHWNARLTVAKVREIRQRIAQGESAKILAAHFGVHRKTIYRIAKGQGWQEEMHA
jgi:hypothetical protein